MGVEEFGYRRGTGDFRREEEHPSVVVEDMARRRRPLGRIITVANEKGGVGKSTIAFHLCVAFADMGKRVLAIDLDRRQQTLAHILTNREGTARRLGADLPPVRSLVLGFDSGAILAQEIARVGNDCDVIVIDAPGHDSAISRRAIALADTLITPVNGSFADIDVLGRFNALTRQYASPGCFAEIISGIRSEREKFGMPSLDWLVVQNRARRGVSHCQSDFEAALAQLAAKLHFRTGTGLSERVAYRELLLMGLSHLDLRHIPGLGASRAVAREEVLRLRDDVGLVEADAEVHDENQLELI